METTVKYPIGIQTFEKIRKEDCLYVDKTALVYKLVSKGQFYFLSRPRRFGKSLLLTTIEAYFEGRKDLFAGLAMQRLEEEWTRHPVILLSLARYDAKEERSLESILESNFKDLEEKFDCNGDASETFTVRFGNIIKGAYKKHGKGVVVLIDEYDAPLVANIDNSKEHERLRGILKSVYTNLKDMDRYIRFGMLTGVTKFSRMTIFSGINNLKDISLLPEYSEICGITEKELHENFQPGITKLAKRLQTDYNGALAALKENYDGYHFTEDSADIYNPFSLLNALDDSRLDPYWFRTGSSEMLTRRLRREKGLLSDILNEKVSDAGISDIGTYNSSPLSLMFQTGYLTIKDYDPRRGLYKLGIPNKEVEKGLFVELLSTDTGLDKNQVDRRMWNIRDAFEEGNPDKGLYIIRSMFAGIPPTVTKSMPEIFYENNLYLLFRLIGIDARAEWWTSDGRIDMLLSMPEYVYVMELKLDGTPEEAIAQINSKNYALQWKYDGRKIFKIGINYTKASRNIDRWIITT